MHTPRWEMEPWMKKCFDKPEDISTIETIMNHKIDYGYINTDVLNVEGERLAQFITTINVLNDLHKKGLI
jgi:hypothetical protein